MAGWLTLRGLENPTATYATSKAALNNLSETLRLELAPFGVSVVTILPGVIDSNLHVNDAAAFEMPPSSRYSAIKHIIASGAAGELLPKGSLSAEKFAELVVDDVMGTGKGGLVSRGPYAVMLRRIGQWAPAWVEVRFPLRSICFWSHLASHAERGMPH